MAILLWPNLSDTIFGLTPFDNNMVACVCRIKSKRLDFLRHTLASRLLKQGTPLPVISGILGHRDSNTTAEYLRVDIEQLRSCTLDLEVLS